MRTRPRRRSCVALAAAAVLAAVACVLLIPAAATATEMTGADPGSLTCIAAEGTTAAPAIATEVDSPLVQRSTLRSIIGVVSAFFAVATIGGALVVFLRTRSTGKTTVTLLAGAFAVVLLTQLPFLSEEFDQTVAASGLEICDGTGALEVTIADAWSAAPSVATGVLVATKEECDRLAETGDPNWIAAGCDRAAHYATGGDWVEHIFPERSLATTSHGWPILRYKMHTAKSGFLGITGVPFVILTMGWNLSVFVLQLATFALDWVVDQRVTAVIRHIPQFVAGILQRDIVVGLDLRFLGLTATAIAAGWGIIRRRTAQAFGNVAFALVALAFGGLMLANYDGYYQNVNNLKQQLTDQMLAVGASTTGTVPAAGSGVSAAELTAPLYTAIVHEPWEVLNFGRQLNSDCEIKAAATILSADAGATDGMVRELIGACEGTTRPRTGVPLLTPTPTGILAFFTTKVATAIGGAVSPPPPTGPSMVAFNEGIPTGRLFGVVMVMLGQIAAGLLILSTAVLAVVSELLVAVAFAVAPVAVVGAAFPGGRNLAGSWVTTLLRGILGLAAGLLFVNLAVIVLNFVINADPTGGDGTGTAGNTNLFLRFAVFTVIAFAALKARKLIPAAAQKLAAAFGNKTAAAGAGGGAVGAAVAGGVAGGLVGGLVKGGAGGGLGMANAAGGVALAKGALSTARKGLDKTTGLAAAAADAAAGEGNRPGRIGQMLAHTRGGQQRTAGGLVTSAAVAAGAKAVQTVKGMGASGGSLDQVIAGAGANEDLKMSQDDLSRLASSGPAAQKFAAGRAETAPADLANLAASRRNDIRRAALANPSTGPDTLQRHAQDAVGQQHRPTSKWNTGGLADQQAILTNPNAPTAAVDHLAQHSQYRQVRAQAAAHPNVSSEAVTAEISSGGSELPPKPEPAAPPGPPDNPTGPRESVQQPVDAPDASDSRKTNGGAGPE